MFPYYLQGILDHWKIRAPSGFNSLDLRTQSVLSKKIKENCASDPDLIPDEPLKSADSRNLSSVWEEPPWLDRDEFDVTECDGELLLLGLASSVPTAPPPPFTPPSGDDCDSAPEQV